MEEVGQFQALIESTEFTGHTGNSLDYEKGIQKNLGMLESLRDRGGNWSPLLSSLSFRASQIKRAVNASY